MTLLFVLLNCFCFLSIAFIHLYWVFGGKLGLDKVIPTKGSDNSMLFTPPIAATIFVALTFLFFTMITLTNIGWFTDWLSPKVVYYASNLMGIIFLLRAIGDFKYVGFTKSVKETLFAKYDTSYYVPLCLFLGLSSLTIIHLL